MVRTKHSSPTEFEYPVSRICGKISRHSKIVHACTASGKKITYIQGQRDLTAHPVSEGELARQSLFKRRQAVVAARIDHKSETYEADLAAFRAQLKQPAEGTKPFPTFQSYLWSLAKAEITE